MNTDIIHSDKFSQRTLLSENPVTKQRVSILETYSYEVFRHNYETDRSLTLFTLILTVYDSNLSYVEKALQSCLQQTYKNLELIIVDNGCTGVFRELLYNSFLSNPTSVLIRFADHNYDPSLSDPFDPIPNLWNAALFASSGEYVYFLSCDDLLSINYCEKMESLFRDNPNCVTASPGIVSINSWGEINKLRSAYYRLHNNRARYTEGLILAEEYMAGTNMLSFPGGLFSVRSQVVIDNGGFDSHNDLSQLFKYGVLGDHGYDPSATLYWRHHDEQANKKQKTLGLVYYKRSIDWYSLYNMHQINSERFGLAYADKFHNYFKKNYEEEAYSGLLDAFAYGGKRSGVNAIKKLYVESGEKKQTGFIVYTVLKLLIRVPNMYLKNFARKVINKVRFESFTSMFVLRQLVKQVKRSRLHLSEMNDYGGIELSYIEYATHVKFPPLSLMTLTYESYKRIYEKSAEINEHVVVNPQLLQLYDTNNHYNLLTELSRQYNAKTILEIGTASGLSLYSWLRNPMVEKVNTFDVLAIKDNQGWFRNPVVQEKVNTFIDQQQARWTQYVCDLADPKVFSSYTDIILSSDIIFIDGPHDGNFERALMTNILSLRNKSEILLIFDDIILSPMVEFWNMLSLPKLDISFIGHQSGTGLVILPSYMDRNSGELK
jgi:glycosyltransferase involved in cell wall biosynthesis